MQRFEKKVSRLLNGFLCQRLFIVAYSLSKHHIVHHSASKRANFRMVTGCYAVSVLDKKNGVLKTPAHVLLALFRLLLYRCFYLLPSTSSEMNASTLDNTT